MALALFVYLRLICGWFAHAQATNDRRILEQAILFTHYESRDRLTIDEFKDTAGLPHSGMKGRMVQTCSVGCDNMIVLVLCVRSLVSMHTLLSMLIMMSFDRTRQWVVCS